jgi:transposase
VSKDDIIKQLRAENATLKEENASFKVLLTTALSRIAELEARLNLDSTNSGKPPSSDGLKKKPAFPRKKGGRRGGKPGHKGNTLKMVAQPDHESLHSPKLSACNCGHSLSDIEALPGEEKRQVFDLPPRLLSVTEHRIGLKCCPGCGEVHKGKFPAHVNAPAQYGPRVRALVSLLNVEQSLPVGRVSELFCSLTGYALNHNTIVSAVNRMAEDLEEETKLIKQKILAAPVAHADETGARIAGKLHWGHDLVTELYTYFFVHERRGRIALESSESITDQFAGTLIHDCWSSYFNLDCSSHGLCGAHLLRELKNLSDNHQREWASQMHDLLMYAYKFSQNGREVLPDGKLKVVRKQFAKILAAADKEEPPAIIKKKGRPKKSKGRNLMDRLVQYEDYVLNFAITENIPFTNNLAERDIRPWKTKLKVSGCFRTLDGAKRYARIKGFCSTVRKHGLSVYEQLLAAMDGRSFLVEERAT